MPKTGASASALQEDRRYAQPRRARSGRRHPRRHGYGRADGAGEVRARGRHADHRRLDVDDLPGVRRHQRRDGRESGGPVRARIGHARRFGDRSSPIAYGYEAQVPVYFSQDPVLNGGGGGGLAGGGGAEIPGVGMNVTPMAQQTNRLTPFDPDAATPRPPAATPAEAEAVARRCRCGRRRGPRRPGGRRFGGVAAVDGPRVVLAFPSNPDEMLLSGVLVGGQALCQPRPNRRHPGRTGPRRLVCHPSVLALADAGHVLPRVQHDPELERSGRRQGDGSGDDDAVGSWVRGSGVRGFGGTARRNWVKRRRLTRYLRFSLSSCESRGNEPASPRTPEPRPRKSMIP